MQRQGSFSQAEYAGKKKQTRRDKFLAEMEQVVPWMRLVERVRALFPEGERGRPPGGFGGGLGTGGARGPARRWLWSGCCGSTFCSNGTCWPIRQWRKHFMTVRRCGAL